MKRYRVEVNQAVVHYVEAETPEGAAEAGIALALNRVRPVYTLMPTAEAEVISETPGICVDVSGLFADVRKPAHGWVG